MELFPQLEMKLGRELGPVSVLVPVLAPEPEPELAPVQKRVQAPVLEWVPAPAAGQRQLAVPISASEQVQELEPA
jgi:hypothetical protein